MDTLLLKGAALGFIVALSSIPALIWCVQITLRHGFIKGFSALSAFSSAQILWSGLAYATLLTVYSYANKGEVTLRLLAAVIFVYLALRIYGARKANSLKCPESVGGLIRIFVDTLFVSLLLPIRYITYLALAIVANIQILPLELYTVFLLACVTAFGAVIWLGYIVAIAALFGHRVPEMISLKSINKLKFLSVITYLALAVISLFPLDY